MEGCMEGCAKKSVLYIMLKSPGAALGKFILVAMYLAKQLHLNSLLFLFGYERDLVVLVVISWLKF